MPEFKERPLLISILSQEANDRKGLVWLLIDRLETFGANVIVKGELADKKEEMSSNDPEFWPEAFRGLNVSIVTKFADEEDA
jgi:hypothetical protein